MHCWLSFWNRLASGSTTVQMMRKSTANGIAVDHDDSFDMTRFTAIFTTHTLTHTHANTHTHSSNPTICPGRYKLGIYVYLVDVRRKSDTTRSSRKGASRRRRQREEDQSRRTTTTRCFCIVQIELHADLKVMPENPARMLSTIGNYPVVRYGCALPHCVCVCLCVFG